MGVLYAFVDVTDLQEGGYKVVIVATVLIVMQFLMLIGRLVSRRLLHATLGADDSVLMIATIFSIALCAIAIAFPIMNEATSDTLGQWFIAWMIIYGLSIAFAKCAILLLYVRVFTTVKRIFTITACLVGPVVISAGLANTFGAIFQCSPLAYAWNKSIKGGHCIDMVAFSRYMAIPNVVTGAVMLVMPLPVVWNLKIDASAKIALTATFLHGIIGFIASCARLSILFSTNLTTFTSGTSLVWTIWTINEPANYIIAACLPTLRPILMRILPEQFFLLSKKRSTHSSSPSPKLSWPRGSIIPRLEFGSRGFQSNSQLTGPWYASNQEPLSQVVEERERDLEADQPGPPRRSYTLERSPAYDVDKKQVMVEKGREEESG